MTVREVRRPRVADRDRRVLAQEQEGGGLADDVGAADDDGVLAREISMPDRLRISMLAWAVAGRNPS